LTKTWATPVEILVRLVEGGVILDARRVERNHVGEMPFL
jgi:hypothetical protein